jgi:hypothetical protein
MQDENIKAKQVRPKQFREKKRIWKIDALQTENTLERKEGKIRKEKERQKVKVSKDIPITGRGGP